MLPSQIQASVARLNFCLAEGRSETGAGKERKERKEGRKNERKEASKKESKRDGTEEGETWEPRLD